MIDEDIVEVMYQSLLVGRPTKVAMIIARAQNTLEIELNGDQWNDAIWQLIHFPDVWIRGDVKKWRNSEILRCS